MKSTSNNKPMPTPYELSRLAMMAGELVTNLARRDTDAAVNLALEVWEKSAAAIRLKQETGEQLDALVKGLWTMGGDEWRERVKDYKGYVPEIQTTFERLKFPTDEVKKRLFPDKNVSRTTRDTLMLGLAKFAVGRGVAVWWDGHPHPLRKSTITPAEEEEIGSINLSRPTTDGYRERCLAIKRGDLPALEEELKRPTLDGYAVRYYVEARRLQIAENRRHGKP